MKYIATVNEREYIIELKDDHTICVDGTEYAMDFQQLSKGGLLTLLLNNRSYEAAINEGDDPNDWHVLLRGDVYDVMVQDERAYRLAKARGELAADEGVVQIKSPMPGVIVKAPVAEGDAIRQGETAVILESMKMENELKSTRDGVVLAVNVMAGETVDKNQVLVVIGDPPEEDET